MSLSSVPHLRIIPASEESPSPTKREWSQIKTLKMQPVQTRSYLLGRIVFAEGYKLDPSTTEPIEYLKKTPPRTVGEFRKLVGLLSYYRRYIKDFSRIAKPLYDLQCPKNDDDGATSGKQDDKSRNQRSKGQSPSNQAITWTEHHQAVLEQLINCLVQPPVMAYSDFNSLYILHTDASETGLGAVLYKHQNGLLRVIAYGSCTLTPTEKNYHLHSGKFEFLALKWAICDQFRDYLYHAPSFTVYTDNNPLTYVLTSAKLNTTGFHWIGELADFNFDIK